MSYIFAHDVGYFSRRQGLSLWKVYFIQIWTYRFLLFLAEYIKLITSNVDKLK